MRKLWAWCRSHLFISLTLAVFGSAIAAHLLANALAEWRWQKYCAESRARGIKLFLKEYAPPDVPESENLAYTPIMMAERNRGRPRVRVVPPLHIRSYFDGSIRRTEIDWKETVKFAKELNRPIDPKLSPRENIDRLLAQAQPQIDEWEEGLRRPYTQFPDSFTKGIAGMDKLSFSPFSTMHSIYETRTRLHLEDGDPVSAFASWQRMRQIAQRLDHEPGLVTAVLQAGLYYPALSSIGYGFHIHGWPEAQLKLIAEELDRIDLRKRREWAINTSRAALNEFLDEALALPPWKQRAHLKPLLGTFIEKDWVFYFTPKRLLRDNQLRLNQWVDALVADGEGKRVTYLHLPAKSFTAGDRPRWGDRYYYFLFPKLADLCSPLDVIHSNWQTTLDQARMACALERHFVKEGSFPEDLQALVPAWLDSIPPDPFTKAPPIYRRLAPGSYRLYSLGVNRIDDGAKPNSKGKHFDGKDMVWAYSP